MASAPRWFCFAALALVPLLANWPVVSGWLTVDPVYWTSGTAVGVQPGPLPGTPMLDGSAGWTSEALGRLAANEWLSGRIPWWNPYGGPGLPLAAEGQNPALFVPFVFLLALPNGLFLLALALQEIAAFATFALLRRLKLGMAAAWTGAALFCLNGTFALFGDQPIMPIAFAPLLLLGIEMEWRAAAAQTRSWGWMLAAVSVAMSLYAAFPETAYIDGLLGAAWATQRFAALPGGRRLRFAGRLAGAAATGVLLAAPYVVPFAHMLAVSDVAFHAGGANQTPAPIATLAVLSLPYVLGPQAFGLTDASYKLLTVWASVGGYFPISQLVLVVAAVLCRGGPHRGLRLVLGGWIGAAAGAMFGVPGVMQAVYAIPLLDQALVYRYSPPSWELAMAVLSAMAIEDWREGRLGRRLALGSAVMAGLAAVLSLAAAWHWVTFLLAAVGHYAWWPVASVTAAAIAVLTVAACIGASPTQRRAGVAAASLVGYAVVLFMVPRLAGMRAAKVDEPALAFLRDGLGLQRFFAMGPIAANYGAYFGIASLNSQYLPNPQIWSDHITGALDRAADPAFVFLFNGAYPTVSANVAQFAEHLPAFAALAVRYAVVPAGTDLPAGLPLRPVYEDGAMRIFEVATAAPYFEVAGGACRVAPQSRELVVTECDRPARLIRREFFFDGWRATVNGRREEITGEGIVQAVAVPAGSATVSFRYLPPYAVAGGGLGLLGVVFLVGGSLWSGGRTSRRL